MLLSAVEHELHLGTKCTNVTTPNETYKTVITRVYSDITQSDDRCFSYPTYWPKHLSISN